VPQPKKSAARAIQKIERSQLNKAKVQRELMGNELGLQDIVVYLKSKLQFETTDRVIDIVVQRDIDAASTVVITLNDYDRTILHSRRLHNALDVQLDGMWFRLVKVERTSGSDELQLTFEQREIAILRSYPKKGVPHNGVVFADRANISRAQFVLRLIREVKEFQIPVVIPELQKVQPIEKKTDTSGGGIDWSKAAADLGVTLDGQDAAVSTGGGIPLNYNGVSIDDRNASPQRQQSQQLLIKGAVADRYQISNVNTVISVGHNMGARRKVIIAAIQTIIQESTARNLKSGDAAHGGGQWDSAGLFQQTGSWGSYQDRTDPATAARLFYKEAIRMDRFEPHVENWTLAADVQRPAQQYRGAYAQWREEAERLANAYGLPGGDDEGSAASANLMGDSSFGAGSQYLYYRGKPAESGSIWLREDSWTCIRRLADEVGWRAFFISGVFYFMSDDDLFKTQPIMIFDESTPGIEGIGFDIDIGKKTSEISVDARTGRWLAPPGAVVLAKNLGPANGRWLVHQFERSIFDTKASITCAKPQAQLPEPLDDQIQTPPSWSGFGQPANRNQQGATNPQTGTSLMGYVLPLGTPLTPGSEFRKPDGPEGMPDGRGNYFHGAKDWFAPGGTPVVAPCPGKVIEVKYSASNSGQVFGGVVKIQEASPNPGRVWVFRHVTPLGQGQTAPPIYEGKRVKAGDVLARVASWTGGSTHCHIEIWKTLSGGYNINNALDPVQVLSSTKKETGTTLNQDRQTAARGRPSNS
jgi:murein DD-endopeptidase MepM/ murein hydrolase activator NlpD